MKTLDLILRKPEDFALIDFLAAGTTLSIIEYYEETGEYHIRLSTPKTKLEANNDLNTKCGEQDTGPQLDSTDARFNLGDVVKVSENYMDPAMRGLVGYVVGKSPSPGRLARYTIDFGADFEGHHADHYAEFIKHNIKPTYWWVNDSDLEFAIHGKDYTFEDERSAQPTEIKVGDLIKVERSYNPEAINRVGLVVAKDPVDSNLLVNLGPDFDGHNGVHPARYVQATSNHWWVDPYSVTKLKNIIKLKTEKEDIKHLSRLVLQGYRLQKIQ